MTASAPAGEEFLLTAGGLAAGRLADAQVAGLDATYEALRASLSVLAAVGDPRGATASDVARRAALPLVDALRFLERLAGEGRVRRAGRRRYRLAD